MNVILQLMFEFFKTGLFAIGGGMATLPFLYSIAERYAWLDVRVIPDMIAIAESTPGPIGINMATYAGFQSAGVIGGILATLSLAFPSVVIIMIVAKLMDRFHENFYVKQTMYGLKPAVCAMVLSAMYRIVRITLLDLDAFRAAGSILALFQWKAVALFAAALALMYKFDKSPILYILASAVIGILWKI